MKSLFRVVAVLLLMLLSACSSSSMVSEEETTYSSEATSPRTLEESGAAVYFDRELERQELHSRHNDLDLDEFIEAMNQSFFNDYFEISGTLDLRSTTLTVQGIEYFMGIDIYNINRWLSTNPFALSEKELEEEKDSFNFAHASRNDYDKLIKTQWAYAMGQYINLAEVDRWIRDNPDATSLDDWNAGYLGSKFVDSQGRANDHYFRETERLIELMKEKFDSFLLEDEQEVFGDYLSDIKVDTTLHVYNYEGDYVFPISAGFSIPHPERDYDRDYDIEGRLYLVVQRDALNDYQANYNVLSRFVDFYDNRW